MSDNWIIVIPYVPNYVPSPDARRKAIELFQIIVPRADEVKEEISQEIRFIDCGSNFERVLCPDCRAELEIEWWQKWMDEEAEAGFPLKLALMPCCSVQHSLDQLSYDWPQGFARYSVEAMNPHVPDLSEEQFLAFESALGCRVRKVLRHL